MPKVSSALIASVILHVGLVIFLYNHEERAESVIINVQYQAGGGEADVGKADVAAKPSSLTAKSSRTEKTQGGPSAHQADHSHGAGIEGSGDSAEVTGESLGLKAAYPKLSRVLGESGQVQIAIKNNQAAINVSSGFERLDESALKTIQEALKTGTLNQVLISHDSLLINFVFRLK